MQVPGPTIHIDCPHCKATGVAASTCANKEQLGVFYIPLLWMTTIFVQCSACRGKSITKLQLDELANCKPHELSQSLVGHVSFVAKFLALARLVLGCVPFVGLALGAIGLLMTFKSGGWPKTLSLIGTVIGTVIGAVSLVGATLIIAFAD